MSCDRLHKKDQQEKHSTAFPHSFSKGSTLVSIGKVLLSIAWVGLLFIGNAGCTQNVLLRGTVTDISGQALPGVVVRIAYADYESLSNGNGRYSVRVAPGQLQVEFLKTGYAPAHVQVTVNSMGIVDMAEVRLWPLPPGEGVFLFKEFRYYQTNHPRVNKYRVEGDRPAWGTPVNPTLDIRYVDPEESPDANPPMMVAHRLPAYDARLHRLRTTKASQVHAVRLGAKSDAKQEAPYNEDIWIADEAIPLRMRPMDEPEKLLLELRASIPLSPGVYAIHWGALDGYESIDPRAFLFSIVEAPEVEAIASLQGGEGENSKEGE